MFAIVLVFLIAATYKVETAKFNCRRIDRFKSVEKCCYLDSNKVIDVNNVTFGGNEIADVQGIYFEHNKKIRFLPVKVYKKFPNLVFYMASNTVIEEILAANFEKLSSLKILDLYDNKIEFIPDDCFQGLTKLYEMNLSTNSQNVGQR